MIRKVPTQLRSEAAFISVLFTRRKLPSQLEAVLNKGHPLFCF